MSGMLQFLALALICCVAADLHGQQLRSATESESACGELNAADHGHRFLAPKPTPSASPKPGTTSRRPLLTITGLPLLWTPVAWVSVDYYPDPLCGTTTKGGYVAKAGTCNPSFADPSISLDYTCPPAPPNTGSNPYDGPVPAQAGTITQVACPTNPDKNLNTCTNTMCITRTFENQECVYSSTQNQYAKIRCEYISG